MRASITKLAVGEGKQSLSSGSRLSWEDKWAILGRQNCGTSSSGSSARHDSLEISNHQGAYANIHGTARPTGSLTQLSSTFPLHSVSTLKVPEPSSPSSLGKLTHARSNQLCFLIRCASVRPRRLYRMTVRAPDGGT